MGNLNMLSLVGTVILTAACQAENQSAPLEPLVPIDKVAALTANRGHTGVNIEQYNSTRIANAAKMMDSPGLEWVRYSIHWSDLEAVEGTYDFSGVEADLDALNSASKQILAVISHGPSWADTDSSCTGTSADRCTPDSGYLDAYGDFLAELEAAFPFIDHYEVWNQTFHESDTYASYNDDEHFEGSPSKEDSLIISAATSLGSGNMIVCCGFIPADAGQSDNDYARTKMDSVGAYIDIISLHEYAHLNQGESLGLIESHVDDVLADLSSGGHGSTPVWLTEFGVHASASDEDIRRVLEEVFPLTSNTSNWDLSFYYTLDRQGHGDANPIMSYSGNQYPDSLVRIEPYCWLVEDAGNIDEVGLCIDVSVFSLSVPENTNCYFTASGSHGSSPYSFKWWRDFSYVGTGSQQQLHTGTADFELTLEVTDSAGATRTRTFSVDVEPTGLCPT